MKITKGLLAGQVLQRLGNKGACVDLQGTVKEKGPVWATILHKGKPLPRWKRRRVGQATGGKFRLTLKNIPVGGPYLLRLDTATHSVEVSEWFVGDVWLMAGQSNMQGYGHISEAAKPHPLVRAFYMDRHWGLAEDPLHVLGESPDIVHYRKEPRGRSARIAALKRKRGAGLGLFFGREMVRRSGGIPQGLICAAQGGTTMKQWNPSLKSQGGNSLYGSMMATMKATGQPVAGMLWYQGESDAVGAATDLYTEGMKALVAAVRRDLRQPGLPWFMVQVGRTLNREPRVWNIIQEEQRLLPGRVANLHVVSAIDLPLEDGIHLRTRGGLDRLAVRLARLADRTCYGNRRELPPPEPESIVCRPGRNKGTRVLEIIFKNVVGRLHGPGEPMGFKTIKDGRPAQLIYGGEVKGNRVFLYLLAAPRDHMLTYGRGAMPAALLVDDRDMPVPAFGPLQITKPVSLTPFIVHWKVSPTLPKTKGLDRIKTPRPQDFLLTEKLFFTSNGFIDMHATWATEKGLTFFFTEIECPIAMKLNVCMDYDAPFRLWVDDRPFFTDMKGTNPCAADETVRPLRLTAGRHRLAVGMDSSGGNAWGFFLRFSREKFGTQPVPLPVLDLKKN